MNHIQITITATEGEQEKLIALLSETKAVGFEQSDNLLLAFFDEEDFNSYDVNGILKGHPFELTTVAEKNWNEEWEKAFEPVVVPGFCGIRAAFHPPITGVPHEIIITPKMSFGTGHHATTYMMVEQMRNMDFGNKQVFDFGTGTGILAILAEQLGAAAVTAIDNDSWSISNAGENIQVNGCSRIRLVQSSVVPQGENFDIILANINRNVILENLSQLVSASNNGAVILLSGLILEDEEAVVGATQKFSMQLVHRAEKNRWLSFLFRRKIEKSGF